MHLDNVHDKPEATNSSLCSYSENYIRCHLQNILSSDCNNHCVSCYHKTLCSLCLVFRLTLTTSLLVFINTPFFLKMKGISCVRNDIARDTSWEVRVRMQIQIDFTPYLLLFLISSLSQTQSCNLRSSSWQPVLKFPGTWLWSECRQNVAMWEIYTGICGFSEWGPWTLLNCPGGLHSQKNSLII